jgi:hypothetical protein
MFRHRMVPIPCALYNTGTGVMNADAMLNLSGQRVLGVSSHNIDRKTSYFNH